MVKNNVSSLTICLHRERMRRLQIKAKCRLACDTELHVQVSAMIYMQRQHTLNGHLPRQGLS